MTSVMTLIIVIILGVVCAYIHKNKGYSPIAGFCWGFFFSIIGLILVLLEKNKEENTGKLSVAQWVLIFVGIGVLLITIYFIFASIS